SPSRGGSVVLIGATLSRAQKIVFTSNMTSAHLPRMHYLAMRQPRTIGESHHHEESHHLRCSPRCAGIAGVRHSRERTTWAQHTGACQVRCLPEPAPGAHDGDP